MSLTVKTENVSENLGFCIINDKKFKTNSMVIRLFTDLKEETTSMNAIIPNLLVSTNEKLKTRTAMSVQLSKLYGANLTSVNAKIGDKQTIGIVADCICDDYSLEGEKITEELCDILINCLFNPLVENGGFALDEFDIRKQELIDNIDSEINEKRTYAILQANRKIYEGEPCSVPAYGKKEFALELDPVKTYEQYLNVLKTAKVEVTLSGGGDFTAVKEKIIAAFDKIERNCTENNFYTFSPLKSEVAEIGDNLDVNQCKMVMAMKTECTDYYAVKLMNTILGGTTFSKLFVNVREKLSLCYYCAASYNEFKGTLLIDSGIEEQNIELARKEILNQVDAIANGDFSDEDLENSVRSIIGDFKSVPDGVRDLSSWYMIQKLRGDNFSPEQAEEEIKKVTRERVIEAAKSFALDTVYTMKPISNSNDKESE